MTDRLRSAWVARALRVGLLPLLLLSVPAGWAQSEHPVRPESVPGGLHLLPLPSRVTAVRYLDRPVLLHRGVAVVGIPLTAEPGEHSITLVLDDGQEEVRRFVVRPKRYEEQHLTIENPRMVNPEPEDLKRIRRESTLMRAEYLRYSTPPGEPDPFLIPVSGPLSSSFGRRRVLNGQPRSPHSGLDIAVPEGTPVRSPAPGRVTLTGDFYFNGKTVFVDHGAGLVSMLCHLSRIDVNPNQAVDRGEVLGLVGATGRVTGPHLHWSVSLNGQRVDPAQVMAVLSGGGDG